MEISEATESTVAMLVSSERQVTSELPRYQQRSSACPDGYVIAASCSVIPGAIGPKTRWAAAHPYRWLNVSVRKFASNHEEPYHGLSSETSSKMHSFFVAASGDCARLKRLMGARSDPAARRRSAIHCRYQCRRHWDEPLQADRFTLHGPCRLPSLLAVHLVPLGRDRRVGGFLWGLGCSPVVGLSC